MEPRLAGRWGPEETTGPTAQTRVPTAEHLVAIFTRGDSPSLGSPACSRQASPGSGRDGFAGSCMKAQGPVVLDLRGRRRVCGESCQLASAPSGRAHRGAGAGAPRVGSRSAPASPAAGARVGGLPEGAAPGSGCGSVRDAPSWSQTKDTWPPSDSPNRWASGRS